jgi:hypothetical protein
MTSLGRGSLLVQLEQPLQDLFVGEIRGPALGGGYGGVEVATGPLGLVPRPSEYPGPEGPEP